jgi:acetyltransferase EpsM
VICDVLRLCGYSVMGFLDDDPALIDSQIMGLPILGKTERVFELDFDAAIVGLGDNGLRRVFYERLRARGVPLTNAIHPTAVIAKDVQLGSGLAVAANVVVNPGSRIGDNVILNTACTVDHDCIIEEHVHIAPGAHLCGGVRVGRGTLIGVGACVIPYKTIGAEVIVGGGAVVTKDLPDRVTAVGNPARIIK